MTIQRDITEKINDMEEAMVQIESDEITYVHIQDSSEGGYDYTLFDEDGEEIDGGLFESEDDFVQLGDALSIILEDETDGDYRIVRILSEDEMEELLEDMLELY